MNSFLKTILGGALGVGALYVVGKICYEVGKDVAEIEYQLSANKDIGCNDPESEEHISQIKDNTDREMDPSDAALDKAKSEMSDALDEAFEKNAKPTLIGRVVNKVKGAKLFLTARKAFDKSGKSPGILTSLLTNPDGARIEAYVRDGGVQINVKPRAA